MAGQPLRWQSDHHLPRTSMSLTLFLALASLSVWAAMLLLGSLPTGLPHLLLALGSVLLVRWWALRG
jgi:hypothetical protein